MCYFVGKEAMKALVSASLNKDMDKDQLKDLLATQFHKIQKAKEVDQVDRAKGKIIHPSIITKVRLFIRAL